MKKYLIKIILGVAFIASPIASRAQFYQIANQLPGLISPALTGGLNYKGYVDASYVAGLGNTSADFLGFSTSQGFRYKSWFFMGVGIGVDVAMSHTGDDFYRPSNYSYTSTGVMIPVFTDFRFNVGNTAKATFFADVKIGASFLMGNSYLAINNGYLSNRQYFYLKPAVGVRIPVGKNGKQGVNVGVTYQLLTSNYWYGSSHTSPTLNSLGATVGFDW